MILSMIVFATLFAIVIVSGATMVNCLEKRINSPLAMLAFSILIICVVLMIRISQGF